MTWTNWAGNQSCEARVAAPADEAEVIAEVRRAIEAGTGLRAAGAGHSFTPVIETSGTVLETTGLRGVTEIDAARRLVTALPGTTVGEFGDPLWAPASRSPTRATSTRRPSRGRSRPARTDRATGCRASRPRCAPAGS